MLKKDDMFTSVFVMALDKLRILGLKQEKEKFIEENPKGYTIGNQHFNKMKEILASP